MAISVQRKAYLDANRDKVRAQQRAYRFAHRDEINAKHKAWREANPEKHAAMEKRWRDADKAGGRTNSARWREQHPERRAEVTATYRERNRDRLRKVNREDQRRRSLGAKDPDTILYLTVILNDPCSYCGAPAGTTDHIDPVSTGGPNHWTNYTPACQSCNSAKKDKSLLMYLYQKANK